MKLRGLRRKTTLTGSSPSRRPTASSPKIADQLVAHGKSWKSYPESLPLSGPDRVNTSDGFFGNLPGFSKIQPTLNPPLTSSDIVSLYASKYNPFVHFRNGPSLNHACDDNVHVMSDLFAEH